MCLTHQFDTKGPRPDNIEGYAGAGAGKEGTMRRGFRHAASSIVLKRNGSQLTGLTGLESAQLDLFPLIRPLEFEAPFLGIGDVGHYDEDGEEEEGDDGFPQVHDVGCDSDQDDEEPEICHQGPYRCHPKYLKVNSFSNPTTLNNLLFR